MDRYSRNHHEFIVLDLIVAVDSPSVDGVVVEANLQIIFRPELLEPIENIIILSIPMGEFTTIVGGVIVVVEWLVTEGEWVGRIEYR